MVIQLVLSKKELEYEYGLSKSIDSLGHIEIKKVSEDSKWNDTI